MKIKIGSLLILMALSALAERAFGTLSEADLPSTKAIENEGVSAPKVTAVYSISIEDYIPPVHVKKYQKSRSEVRGRASRPRLDFPDVFYFVGIPLFLFVFAGLLVNFIKEFEEQQREEERQVASEISDLE